LLVIVGLSGCNQLFSDKRFVGTWRGNSDADSITYFSDGTFTAGAGLLSGGGIWEIKDGKLVLSTSNNEIMTSFGFSFSNNDNSLTLTVPGSGYSQTYQKQ
jgi:hypothetical protein